MTVQKAPRRRVHRQSPEPGRTKATRLAYERLMAHALETQMEGDEPYLFLHEIVPKAWDTLESDVDVEEKKIRLTLRVDESVAKFYRAMGPGYQARMNRVLATFAQMRIAKVREAEDRMARFRAERLAEEG